MRFRFPELAFACATAGALPLVALSSTFAECSTKLELAVAEIKACEVTALAPFALEISTAEPGDQPEPALDESSTYAISANSACTLSASGAQVPAGVNLDVIFGASGNLAATQSLALATHVEGGSAEVEIFNQIQPGCYNGTVSYRAHAPVTTNPFASQAFTVDYFLR